MPKIMVYATIWAVLVAATLMEVIARFLPTTVNIIIFGIISISSVKALLIASYYQNLRYETRVLAFIPIAAIILLSILLVTAIAGGFRSV